MNISFFISRRLAASGQRTFSRFIIRMAVVSVAISIAVMIVSTALITGFKNQISEKIFGFWGHIHITDIDIGDSILEAFPIRKDQPFYTGLDTIADVPYVEERSFLGLTFETEGKTRGGIRHAQVFGLIPGIIASDDQIEGIILKGISTDFDWSFLQKYLVAGNPINLDDSLPSRDILLSAYTADRLKVEPGDVFEVYFVEGNAQLVRRFNVSGIYKTGLEEYDKKFALVDLRHVQKLHNWTEEEISGFELFVDNIGELDVIRDYIYFEVLPNYLFAETIRQRFPEIFEWLELQNINEVVILTLMALVAIINMMTTLLILILERTKMIGTLKALGAGNWTIRKIFLYNAGHIILLGMFWGNLLGIGLSLLQQYFGFIRLSEENYYLSVAPIELQFWSVLLVNTGTLLLTLVFLIIPTYLVTRIDPVKAIRFR